MKLKRPIQKVLQVVENITNPIETIFYNMRKPKYPIQIVKSIEKLITIPVKIDNTGQFDNLEINLLQLNIFGSKRIFPVDIISYYYPKNGLFLWEFTIRYDIGSDFWKDLNGLRNTYLSKNLQFVYLSESRIAYFSINSRLRIRESCSRYENIEEAYKRVIFTLESNIQNIEQGNDYKWYNVLPIENEYIESDFFYLDDPFDYAPPCPRIKIIQVTRLNDLWQIELEGVKQRKATLILRNKQENQEEPILLTDHYYRNRRRMPLSKKYYLQEGLLLPEYDYEVLEVWVDGIKQEIL